MVTCVANEQKTWQLLLGLMWKNKSHVMPGWIYFSFWMAPADVWGILDFLSASIAQLAPLGEVLVLGDVCVVSLHFDLRTLLPLHGDCSHPSHWALSTSHCIRFSAFAISSICRFMPAPWEGSGFSQALSTSLFWEGFLKYQVSLTYSAFSMWLSKL